MGGGVYSESQPAAWGQPPPPPPPPPAPAPGKQPAVGQTRTAELRSKRSCERSELYGTHVAKDGALKTHKSSTETAMASACTPGA